MSYMVQDNDHSTVFVIWDVDCGNLKEHMVGSILQNLLDKHDLGVYYHFRTSSYLYGDPVWGDGLAMQAVGIQ